MSEQEIQIGFDTIKEMTVAEVNKIEEEY